MLFLLIIFKFLKKEAVPPELPLEISPTPTEFIPSPIIPTTPFLEEKGDPDFNKEVGRDLTNYYPLSAYLPYKTNNFSLGYTNSLTLIAVLKKDTPEIRQEVLDWISSKKIDPSTHKIIWKIK